MILLLNHLKMMSYLELFQKKELLIVPQILSELYSLLKRDAKTKGVALDYWLTQLIPYLELLTERFIPKDEIIIHEHFKAYGFTDIALIKILENENIILITADFNLIHYCKSRGLQVIHPEEIFT